MFFERKEEEKLHKGSVLAGYDLGDKYSQISYCILGEKEGEGEDIVESVATVVGTKQYHIPTVLYKRKGVNQWFYGKDALKGAPEEGTLVTGLVEAAKKGEQIMIEEEAFDALALLTLFLKRSLTLLSFIAPIEKIDALMFTVDKLDDGMVEALAKAAVNLGLKTSRIYFQSHMESFYYFVLHQPKELWNYQVLACEHDGTGLKTYRLECNKKTTPIVVFIEEQSYPTLILPTKEEEEAIQKDSYRLADEKFLDILQRQCSDRIVSAAYLLGDGFRENWAEESLRFLCRNRRVFQGNNLFCKGACFGLLEKVQTSEAGQTHIFLGPDKLKANIGMKIKRGGKDSYFALLDAGENWYEAKKECDFLLSGEEKVIALTITPLDGSKEKIQEIVLENNPIRPEAFSRYHMEITMRSAKEAEVVIKDLGFGELFASTGKNWKQSFLLG